MAQGPAAARCHDGCLLCGGQKSRCSTARVYGAAQDCQRRTTGASISGAKSFHDIKSVVETDGVPLARQGYAHVIAGTCLFLVSNDGDLIKSVAGLTDPDDTVLVGQQD
jgi:hypothetical protein